MKTLRVTSEVRAVNAQELTVDIVASTFALDSYHTRIDPAGGDFTQFRKNPVICYAHDDRGYVGEGSGLPVARALPETIRVEDGKLRMKIQFTPEDVNEFGYKVFRMVNAGFISGVSISFDPIDSKDNEEAVDGRNIMVRTYTKWRLIETSIVTLPANGDALVQRARQNNREDEIETFRTLASEIETEAKARTSRMAQTVDDVLSMLDDCPAKELIVMHRSYFERKKPANKIATRVLKRFFERVLNEEPPTEETEAWEKMDQAVEAMEVSEKTEEIAAEAPAETTEANETAETQAVVPATEETPETAPEQPSTPPVQADPEPERTASVQIPLSVLAELPGLVTRSYMDAAVEALRRGIPVKEVDSLIDGLNGAVSQSLSTPIHGQRNPTPA